MTCHVSDKDNANKNWDVIFVLGSVHMNEMMYFMKVQVHLKGNHLMSLVTR